MVWHEVQKGLEGWRDHLKSKVKKKKSKVFIHSFIYFLNYKLSTYYMLGTIPGTGDSSVTKRI